jgi:hypothetical protein
VGYIVGCPIKSKVRGESKWEDVTVKIIARSRGSDEVLLKSEEWQSGCSYTVDHEQDCVVNCYLFALATIGSVNLAIQYLVFTGTAGIYLLDKQGKSPKGDFDDECQAQAHLSKQSIKTQIIDAIAPPSSFAPLQTNIP